MKAIPYRIVSVSSQDQKYPASNLLKDDVNTGYCTLSHSSFPQQINIEFIRPIQTQQIKYVSHQLKVATKIQIFSKIKKDEKYKRLGFFELHKPKPNHRQTRITHLIFPICLLKFVFSKPHNQQTQIGIQSLTIIGEYLQPVIFSIFQQSAFRTYLNQLASLKEQAIVVEDFGLAAKIKMEIEKIKQNEEELIWLEERKQKAIKDEDFEMASKCKYQTDEILMKAKSQKQKPELSYQFHSSYPIVHHSSILHDSKITEKERPLPTLTNKSKQIDIQEDNSILESNKIEKLSPKNRSLIQPFIFMGESLWTKLFAKDWKLQQQALINFHQLIQKRPNPQNQALFYDGIICAIYFSIASNSKLIIQLSLDLLESLLHIQFKPSNQSHCEFIVEYLAKYLSSNTAKIKESATNIFKSLGDLSIFGKTMCMSVLKKEKKKERIEMISYWVERGWAVEGVLKWAIKFIEDPKSQIRSSINQLLCKLTQYVDYDIITNQIKFIRQPIRQVLMIQLDEAMEHKNPSRSQLKKKNKLSQHSLINQFYENNRINESHSKSGIKINDSQKSEGKKMPHKKMNFFIPEQSTIFNPNQQNFNLKQAVEVFQDSRSELKSKQQIDPYQECQFCGLVDPRLKTDEEFLTEHFQKKCPILHTCQHCKINVQIWNLTAHYLQDCEQLGEYKQCPLCKLAIHNLQYSTHLLQKCSNAKQAALRCQLCQKEINPPTRTGWRRHMLNGLCPGCQRSF